jgi:hypothetical protein
LGYTRACHRHFLFPVPNYHTEFLTFFLLLSALFLLRAPRLQSASSREISHKQAGQCGSQVGTNFKGVVCDEQSTGGDGEYCGDNDAQLGRISFYKSKFL